MVINNAVGTRQVFYLLVQVGNHITVVIIYIVVACTTAAILKVAVDAVLGGNGCVVYYLQQLIAVTLVSIAQVVNGLGSWIPHQHTALGHFFYVAIQVIVYPAKGGTTAAKIHFCIEPGSSGSSCVIRIGIGER